MVNFLTDYGSLCSEPEAMDQPQASAHAQTGDGKEYTQIPSPESVKPNKPQELAAPSQNKGELYLFIIIHHMCFFARCIH